LLLYFLRTTQWCFYLHFLRTIQWRFYLF